MKEKSYFYVGSVAATLALGVGLWTATQADPPARPKVPKLQVDSNWPKPLPVAGQFGTTLKVSTANGKPLPWVTGEVAGTCVDSQDHVITVNRGNLIAPETNANGPTAIPSPTVIEYDSDGNVVNAFNVTGRQAQIHGCFVDYQDNIWI